MDFKRSSLTHISRPDTAQYVAVSLGTSGHISISLCNNAVMDIGAANRVILLLEAAVAEAEQLLGS